MMEPAEGTGDREEGEDRGVMAQRHLFSCSLHHVLQKQLCMHTESKICPELVKGVDTLTTTQERESSELSLSERRPEIGGVNCHV